MSRARRVVENAFGILSSRFRVLRNPILQNYENAVKTVKAAVVLHNYILQKQGSDTSLTREHEDDLLCGSWEAQGSSQNFGPLSQLSGNRSGTREARAQRDRIAVQFLTDNLAPWQFQKAFQCT